MRPLRLSVLPALALLELWVRVLARITDTFPNRPRQEATNA